MGENSKIEWTPEILGFDSSTTFYGKMYKTGKKVAGRVLDGRTWDELPEVPA